ncbi:LuxR C-terminal-related transcriptional regulator [Vreelandella titanicae]|uniref:helix-turn-helix transcriptional regulator n=1 Tax=Vreelandella titanicae TaxID=664683 RepID=UPI0039BFBFEB
MNNITRAFDLSLKSLGALRYAYFYSGRHDHHPSIITNLPDEWLSEYEENALHRIDPVLDISKNTVLPFSWLTAELNKKNQQLSINALKYKIFEGHTFTTISHDREVGILTLCLDNKETSLSSTIKKNEAEIQFCLIKYHEQYKQLYTYYSGTNEHTQIKKLSCREIEVLRWVSSGKTYSEAAVILGITERTIKFHVSNIKKKLDVYSSRQLASIATKYGLIHL